MHSEARHAAIRAEAIAVARARLHEMSGATGDDSLRLTRAAGSIRGLASLVGTLPAIDSFDPEGWANLLMMIAEDIDRCIERRMIEDMERWRPRAA